MTVYICRLYRRLLLSSTDKAADCSLGCVITTKYLDSAMTIRDFGKNATNMGGLSSTERALI